MRKTGTSRLWIAVYHIIKDSNPDAYNFVSSTLSAEKITS